MKSNLKYSVPWLPPVHTEPCCNCNLRGRISAGPHQAAVCIYCGPVEELAAYINLHGRRLRMVYRGGAFHASIYRQAARGTGLQVIQASGAEILRALRQVAIYATIGAWRDARYPWGRRFQESFTP